MRKKRVFKILGVVAAVMAICFVAFYIYGTQRLNYIESESAREWAQASQASEAANAEDDRDPSTPPENNYITMFIADYAAIWDLEKSVVNNESSQKERDAFIENFWGFTPAIQRETLLSGNQELIDDLNKKYPGESFMDVDNLEDITPKEELIDSVYGSSRKQEVIDFINTYEEYAWLRD